MEESDMELPSLEVPDSTIVSTVSVPNILHKDPISCKSSPLYSPLRPGSREIRVFEVTPPNKTNESALCGRLRVVDLDDNPNFTALSYVWGKYSIPPHRVSFGSSSIKVTTNCHSALHQLRKSFNPLTIWVDSICINQENIEEKASQIPLMGDIYPMAESVYIWLGEGSPDSDQAIDHLSNIGLQKFLTPHGKFNYLIPEKSALLWKIALFQTYVWPIKQFKAHALSDGLLSAIHLTTFALVFPWPEQVHEALAPSVTNFLLKEWNERVWTLQEIALATDPIIFCGTRSVTWRCFIHSITYLEQAPDWQSYSFRNRMDNRYKKWRSIVSLWLAVNSELRTWRQDEESSNGCEGRLSISASTGVLRDVVGYYAFLKSIESKRITFFNVQATFALLVALPTVILGVIISTWALVTYVLGTALGIMILWAIQLVVYAKKIQQHDPNDYDHFGKDVETTRGIIDEILLRKTTDARDRSHGMRAVLSKLGVDLPAPDPLASKNVVFRDLFIGLTKWSGSLRLLLFASAQSDGDSPSWVPDFDGISNMWLKEYFFHRRLFSIEKGEWIFCENIIGSSFSEAKLSFANDNKKLLVRGYTIGEVKWKGDKFLKMENVCDNTDTTLHLQNIRAVCEPWYLYKQSTGFSTGTWLSWNKPLLRDLYALCVDKNMTVETSARDISDWWSKINQWKGPSSTAEDFLKKLSTRPSMLELHLSLCNNLASKNRCFFHALNSPRQTIMFGNGPETLELGDKIVAIEHVPAPLVIRRELERESFRLIGFAEFGQSPWGRSTGNHFELQGRQWEEILLR